MKKVRWFFIVLILLAVLSAVSACEKPKEPAYPSVDDIEGLSAVQNDGTLYFEWLGTYMEQKPLLIVFHGEEDAENVFSVNLAQSVYTSDVLVSTAGYGGVMRLDKNNRYDVGYFWMSIAKYNVAVFHWERFADEADTDSLVAKIFSAYKSRYKVNGVMKENVFSYPLADVVFALYSAEMQKVSVAKKEIRFAGAGVGALLAEAVATKACINGQKDIIPYRVALCDAPIADEYVSFETPWLEKPASVGTVDLISAMNKKLIRSGVTIEVYESKEVSLQSVKFAYPHANRDGVLEKIKDDVSYLLLAESYSAGEGFAQYKTKKRLALDWYMYSVIGSDDPTVGCDSTSEVQDLSQNNRGISDTRPILNERSISNSEPNKRGRNYGLSAWTPTVYVRALRGISFTQKTGAKVDGYDIHGRNKYHYGAEYVLEKFSSENYQVSDRGNYTVLCGYVFHDLDKNNIFDDGVTATYENARLKLSLTVFPNGEAEGQTVFTDQIVTSDSDGFFVIRLEDAESKDEAIRIRTAENGLFVVSGIYCEEQSIGAELSFIYTDGISSYFGQGQNGLFYSIVSANRFTLNKCTTYVTLDTVHSVLFANCAYTDLDQ